MLVPPIWTGHSDFTNLFEFATFMRMADGLDFDVMLEGKAKDISLLKLRPDLLRYAPDVAARFGIFADAAERLAREKSLEEGVCAEEEADVEEGVPRSGKPPEPPSICHPGRLVTGGEEMNECGACCLDWLSCRLTP